MFVFAHIFIEIEAADLVLNRFITGIKIRKSKSKLALSGLWLRLTRWKYSQNFRPFGHREPVVMGRFCICTMRCSLRTPRGVFGAANTSRLAAAGRGSGNNTCECFIESPCNACLKVMFLQDRRTSVAYFWVG